MKHVCFAYKNLPFNLTLTDCSFYLIFVIIFAVVVFGTLYTVSYIMKKCIAL